MDIQEVNRWLKEQADGWAKREVETSWPNYYSGLMDLDKQRVFSVSTVDLIWGKSPLAEYLKENMDLYRTEGFTGYCLFVKKNNE